MSADTRFPQWCHAKRNRAFLSSWDGLEGIFKRISHGGEAADRQVLLRLWMNWEMVMGPDLAPMAFPLGRRKNTLLVGGEDSMILQELAFQKDEILERANAFMGKTMFTRIELSLAMGRTDLTLIPDLMPPMPITPEPTPPPGFTGCLDFDPNSPVGAFYHACIRRFGKA